MNQARPARTPAHSSGNRLSKVRLILSHEMATAFRSRSFLFVTFGVPLVAGLILLAASLLGDRSGGTLPEATPAEGTSQLNREGYVDYAGLIRQIHPDVPEGILVPYPGEAQAKQALGDGEITAYYVIGADYLQTGDLIYVNPGYSPREELGQSWVMRSTIFANLLGNDPERLARAGQAMKLQETALATQPTPRDESPSAFYIPYGTMMVLYLVIMMSASMLLNSVGTEKKTRVMEVLLLSVTPRQMLAGKIIGLGLLGLLQTAIWLGTCFVMLKVGGQTFSLPPDLLPPSVLAWGLVYSLLGYVVYASLMASLGALAPNLREASQAVIIVIWPLLIPMFCLPVLIERSQGPLATALSIFPLTAPVSMMARLATGSVPVWQLLLSVVLLIGTAVLVIRVSSSFFRAQNLLSGQPFSARRFLTELAQRTP